MLRAVSNRLFDHLLAAFPADHAYGRDALAEAPMPAPVAFFLTHALLRRVEAEAEHVQPVSSAWFDHDHPEVRQTQEAYLAALARHPAIPEDEWEAFLRRAVEEVTAHLVQPIQTLTAFVFDGQGGALDAEAVERRMGYFAAYPYLRETAGEYLRQKGLHHIDRDRFRRLLARVDQELAEDYETLDWLDLLQPLFDLLKAVPGQEGVPVPLLMAFFREKNADVILHRLQTWQERHEAETIDEKALHGVLALAEVPAAPPAPPPVETAAPAEATAPEPPPRPAFDEAPTEQAAASKSVPLWQQFQQQRQAALPPHLAPPPRPVERPVEQSRPVELPRPAAQPHPVEQSRPVEQPRPVEPPRPVEQPLPAPAAAAAAVPLWQRFRQGGVQSEEELARVELAVLGEKAAVGRDRYVRALFGGSPEAYAYTLQRLQRATSWPEASQIIAQDVFRAHQVNIYSDPAVAFTEAVEARFRAA